MRFKNSVRAKIVPTQCSKENIASNAQEKEKADCKMKLSTLKVK